MSRNKVFLVFALLGTLMDHILKIPFPSWMWLLHILYSFALMILGTYLVDNKASRPRPLPVKTVYVGFESRTDGKQMFHAYDDGRYKASGKSIEELKENLKINDPLFTHKLVID